MLEEPTCIYTLSVEAELETDDLSKNFWVVCRCWYVVCMIRTVDPAYCDFGVRPCDRMDDWVAELNNTQVGIPFFVLNSRSMYLV